MRVLGCLVEEVQHADCWSNIELEADYYSGHHFIRMGAYLEYYPCYFETQVACYVALLGNYWYLSATIDSKYWSQC